MMRLKKILVPIDFSEESELAVEWAVSLAKEESAPTLYLLHVIAPIVTMPEPGYDSGRLLQCEMDDAKKKLESWQAKVPPLLTSMTSCVEGNLTTQIKTFCGREDIDLVIMTTHGRRGLSRLVHPNITEEVVREAPCPVLVLHLNPKMKTIAEAGV